MYWHVSCQVIMCIKYFATFQTCEGFVAVVVIIIIVRLISTIVMCGYITDVRG